MKKISTIVAAALLCLAYVTANAEERRVDSLLQKARAANHTLTQAKSKNAVKPSSPTMSKGSVGVIEYTRGAATLQDANQSAQLVGRGTAIKQKDVITTGKKSFAILKLSDGTRLTLRPNSKFSVEEFNPSKTQNASATLRLFKGGLRSVTGFISKYNSNGFKLRTPVATMGIRGTEFDARLCDEVCEQERKTLKKVDLAKPKAVGRVAFLRGQMAAKNKDGNERVVRRGEPIYEGDTLVSGNKSFGVVAFRDKSRITLQSRTQFQVEKFSFNEDKPEKNIALMSLLRGGLRAVTGKIGKINRNNYRMRTPVATIGIRGTGYDLQCQGSCVAIDNAYYAPNEPSLVDKFLSLVSQPAYADEPAGDGMYASVWSGSIQINQTNGSQVLLPGQFAFVPSFDAPARVLKGFEIPLFIRNNTAPRPDEVDIDEDALFAELDESEATPGLYVSVYDGVVSMEGDDGKTIDIGAGEAGFSSNNGTSEPVRLAEQPVFQLLDAIPNPADITNISILDDQGEVTLECEII